jgi:predicted enzyme related to lactoylglutathione lyase
VPDEGPASYLGLQLGDSELGIVADGSVESAPRGRVLLSIEVVDVDAVLARVEFLGGRAPAPATDMPWAQRVAPVQERRRPDHDDRLTPLSGWRRPPGRRGPRAPCR